MTPQSIITLARDPLNDTDAVTPRASDAELVRAVNAGIKELAIIQPALFTRVHSFTCAAGAEQTLDYATDIALVNVLSIHNGAGLTPLDRHRWTPSSQPGGRMLRRLRSSGLRLKGARCASSSIRHQPTGRFWTWNPSAFPPSTR